MNRRRFIGLGTAAAAGLGRIDRVLANQTSATPADPRIRRQVTLGRTGLRVTDISFGSSSLSDPDLVRHALDRGVTFFDTAESYRFGLAEKAIGEGLLGVRERVVLSSKTKAGAGDTQSDMMEALENSLRRLKTDYLDIYFNHAVNAVERMANTEWWEFTERAKAQGKIRFRGMSGHGGQLARCLDYGIDHDLADVILVAYSFAQDPDFYARLRHTFHYVAQSPQERRRRARHEDPDGRAPERHAPS
jgi:aryl-alcohol dehydrogenase-like predicted oxidoreductase